MRARSGQVVWRDRRGRGDADPSAHPGGHLNASRRFGRVRNNGNVDTCRHDDDDDDDADDDDGG
eukprot:661234-Pyramimonas_sp.AAC.1